MTRRVRARGGLQQGALLENNESHYLDKIYTRSTPGIVILKISIRSTPGRIEDIHQIYTPVLLCMTAKNT